MHVTFSGAAREVTGSCLVLPIPPEQLSAIVSSHAHIDHAGRLPLLTRRGFTETI